MSEPVVEGGFDQYATATRVRDAVAQIAANSLGESQPLGFLARCISINGASRKANVWLPGDDTPIEVNLFPNLIPYSTQESFGETVETTSSTAGSGARVWVERINDKLFITEVLSGPTLHQASGGFENYTDAIGPEAGQSGKPWYVRTGASTSVVVPLPAQGWCTMFGPFGGALGEGFTEIVVTDMTFGASKTYQFQGLASQALLSTPEYFQKLIPRFANFAEDVDTNRGDFELEIGNTAITPANTSVPEYHIMLRIRRKGDNQGTINTALDGYRVVIRSVGGMTQRNIDGGQVPFRTSIVTATEPTDVYGAQAFSSTQSLPDSGAYETPAIDFPRRIQTLLTGGQPIWDGSTLSFSSFKIMFTGRHTHTFSVGEQFIDMPANGTAITMYGSNSVSSIAVGATGIPMLPGDALYYAVDPGAASSASDPGKFRMIRSEKSMGIPANWVFIAGATGTIPSLKLGTGESYDHRRTPTLAATWGPYGGLYEAPTYFMTAGRIVNIEGFFTRASGATTAQTTASTVFTLPAGFRPKNAKIFPQACGLSNISPARIDILSTGEVQLVYAGATNWITLETIRFRAFQ